MKLTNSTRVTAPQTEGVLGAADKSATPATSTRGLRRLDGLGSALKSLRKALSTTRQPATPAPRRAKRSLSSAEAHRSDDVAAAIEHMHRGRTSNTPKPTNMGSTHSDSIARTRVSAKQIASTSRAHSQPPRRLGELMHEERSTSLTERFTAKGKSAAEFQTREPEPPIPRDSQAVAVSDEQEFEAALAAMQSRQAESKQPEITPAIRAIMQEMGRTTPRASRKPALGVIQEERDTE